MRYTRQFQCKFDDVLLKIEEEVHRTNLSVQKVIAEASKDVTMTEDFKQRLSNAKDVAKAFNWIRVYSTWYQGNLLSHLGNLLCKSDFVQDYVSELRGYFSHRVTPLPPTKEEEMLFVRVDSAWDAEALQGEQCIASCKQIAAILQKQGRVTGTLHKPYLFISVAS